jgi:hypothetical protein
MTVALPVLCGTCAPISATPLLSPTLPLPVVEPQRSHQYTRGRHRAPERRQPVRPALYGPVVGAVIAAVVA